MKSIRSYFSSLLVGLRPLAIAAVCALVMFASAAPALAFGNSSSSPSKGSEQLNDVQKKSERAIAGPNSDANDAESVMKNSAEGLNGVQGAGDTENMSNPANARGESVEQNIKEALENITP